MFKKIHNSKGFSLVELIIVIVIIGVLVGIAVPSYLQYVQSSRKAADIANAKLILTAAEAAYAKFATDNNAATGTDDASVNAEVLATLKTTALPTSQIKDGKVMVLTGTGTPPVYKVTADGVEILPNTHSDWQ